MPLPLGFLGASKMAAAGGGPAVFETSTFGVVTDTTITVNVPSGVEDGDLLVAVVGVSVGGATMVNDVSGLTKILNDVRLYSAGGTTAVSVFIRIASSEPASYDFTTTSSVRLTAVITRWSNVDTTTPIESSSTNGAYGTADTTVRSSTVTTTASEQTVVNIATVYDTNVTSFTPPTNYTEHFDNGDTYSGSSNRVWIQISSYDYPSPGATGDVDATASRADQEKLGIALVLTQP